MIEDYEVHNLLGKGGFASVYRARSLKQGTEVAIKMIEKKVMQAKNMVNRVRQEVAIHLRLKHPSICELYDCFEDNNYIYLVMELCHNGDLQKYVKEKKRLSENEVSNIMRPLVEGIRYIHSHNVLHRDLSLTNILLTRGGQVKIADFGLATQLTRADEKHMTMCGTPNFISPEVASRGSHGLEADIWGLGCILYTLLVGFPPFDTPVKGSPPFHTPVVNSTLTKIVMSSYSLPDHLSAEAKDLINSLLHKNPKERMKVNQILDHPFMKRSRIISSHRLHDSGIHTMSSKRDSTFRDKTPLPHSHNVYTTNDRIRKTNSDCLPLQNTNSQFCTDMERLRIHTCEDIPAYRDLGQREQTSKCCSRYSTCCCNQQEVRRTCSGTTSCLRSCCQERHVPADPGGCNSHHLKCSTALHSHHSDPPYNDNTNNHLYNHSSTGNTHTCHDRTEKYVKQREPSPRRYETVKTSLTPLCSERLMPNRTKTETTVTRILEDGEVCIEFIKRLGSKKDYVYQVMRISTDGMRIVLYELGGKGVPLDEKPVPMPVQGADKIYGLENLPQKYWNKYRYAVKFVDMIRAKTPKVTYYSDKAKLCLMENLTDFEASFYDGGKVTKSSAEGITIIDASGHKFNFVSQAECAALSGTLDLMWTHSQDCFNKCTLYEKMLSTVPDSFPIIVGHKPSSAGARGKENRPQTMPSFAVSSTTGTNIGSAFRNKSNTKEKKVVIPGIGTAVRLGNGEVQVRFSDGSQLSINGNDVHYQYTDGRRSSYKNNEKMPMIIMEKVNLMPIVLKYISPSSVVQKTVNLR